MNLKEWRDEIQKRTSEFVKEVEIAKTVSVHKIAGITVVANGEGQGTISDIGRMDARDLQRALFTEIFAKLKAFGKANDVGPEGIDVDDIF